MANYSVVIEMNGVAAKQRIVNFLPVHFVISAVRLLNSAVHWLSLLLSRHKYGLPYSGGSHDGSVGKVTRLCSIQGGDKRYFLFFPNRPDRLWCPGIANPRCTGLSLNPGVHSDR